MDCSYPHYPHYNCEYFPRCSVDFFIGKTLVSQYVSQFIHIFHIFPLTLDKNPQGFSALEMCAIIHTQLWKEVSKMGFIRLSLDSPVTFVNVPGIFIDKYMTEANGEFVKVYLYLLYCMNQDSQGCSVSAIADHFNHTENDILRALRYWEKAGVLALEWSESGELVHISFMDLGRPESSSPAVSTPVAPAPVAPVDSTPAKKEYSLNELQAFGNDPDVAELLFITEQYLRRTLNPSEMGTIIYWMDSLKMSRNLAEYLIEYCVGGGHTSLHYMDKVALGWAKDGITSVEDAKAHVTGRSKACFGVMKALGITSRSLVESEAAYVEKWTKEYGFTMDIIEEACKRTILSTHQPSFEYTDSILTNWHSKQVHNLKDIESLDASYNKAKKAAATSRSTTAPKKNRFTDFNQRSYDFVQLEKDLLNTNN